MSKINSMKPSQPELHGAPLIVVGTLSVDASLALNGSLVPGDQVDARLIQSIGGAGAIAAHNVAALGGRATFYGHIGASPQDVWALDQLQYAGVVVAGTVATPSGLRVINLVEPSGDRTMVACTPYPAWDKLRVDVPSGTWVLAEGWPFFGRGAPEYTTLLRRLSDGGLRLVIDLSSASRAADPEEHLNRVVSVRPQVLLANEIEADAYGLERRQAAEIQVIHRGADPVHILRDSRPTFVTVQPQIAIDTTGAGDTFAGVLVACLNAGRDLKGAVQLAAAAASLQVTLPGALIPISRPTTEGEILDEAV